VFGRKLPTSATNLFQDYIPIDPARNSSDTCRSFLDPDFRGGPVPEFFTFTMMHNKPFTANAVVQLRRRHNDSCINDQTPWLTECADEHLVKQLKIQIRSTFPQVSAPGGYQKNKQFPRHASFIIPYTSERGPHPLSQ